MTPSDASSRNRRWRGRILHALLAFTLCALPVAPLAQAGYSAASANRYLAARQWDDLLRYAQNWTKAQPQDSDAWYYLAETYSIGYERPVEAVGPLRRALGLRPVWPQGWNSLGLVQTKLKQPREAAAAFKRAVEQSPRTMNYWFNLASAQSALGDFDGARDTLIRGGVTAGPSTGYEDWFNLGLGLNQLHDCAGAANAYAQAVERNPRLAEGWNNLAACQQQLGQVDQARASYRKAVALGHSFAAANLRQMEQQQKVRRGQPRAGGGNELYDQYRQRRSCSSGGSGVTGPCSESDMRPQ